MSSPLASSFASAVSGLVSPAQSITLDVQLDGQNLTQSIDQSLIELVFIDKFAGNTYDDMGDVLTLEIADPEGLFRTQFTFATAQSIDVSVAISNWNPPFGSTLTRQFNRMWVKTVDISARVGEGTSIKLICSSCPPQSPYRLQRKSGQFPPPGSNPTTLQQLAQTVASQDGLTGGVIYNAPTVQIDDLAQHDHSDAFMLFRLCSEKDFGIKIVNSTIFIQDRAAIDNLPAIGTFYCPVPGNVGGWNGCGIEEWTFREESEDVYGSCTVSAYNSTTSQTCTGTATDPNATTTAIHNEKLVPHSPSTESQDDIDQENAED